jgi:hypothetical protein
MDILIEEKVRRLANDRADHRSAVDFACAEFCSLELGRPARAGSPMTSNAELLSWDRSSALEIGLSFKAVFP